jgi:hypothetical protein
MRDQIREILQGYKSLKLVSQDDQHLQFSAQEPDTKQPVSIRILPRLLSQDHKIASQFRGLSQTIRQLNHPNIASIRQVGEESGLPYMITRAIEKAQPLASRLDQPWAVDTAADVVEQVGHALEHAYNKGIVHGSLTPDNVLIEKDGRVLVTDFGLDGLMDLVGVPAKKALSPYLAPERVAGEKAGAQADVYSLAAILYGLLTKRQPQVVKGEILPPSRFNPDVSEKMDQVVVKGLAPDPADRFPDVKTFLAALGASTVVRAEEEAQSVTVVGRCPSCGAKNQSGRFCRRCGTRIDRAEPTAPTRSVLDEPIQVTEIDVGRMEQVGEGVKLHETVIAKPRTVATGDLLAQFPEPLEMPQIDAETLWPSAAGQPLIAMPEPPPMPTVDWAEIAPPMPEVPVIDDTPWSEEAD